MCFVKAKAPDRSFCGDYLTSADVRVRVALAVVVDVRPVVVPVAVDHVTIRVE